MVNVGLVTGTRTPSARHAPRTNVVLPAPSSPDTRTTSPGRRPAARSAASASVSAAAAGSVSTLAAGMRPALKGEAGAEGRRGAGGGEAPPGPGPGPRGGGRSGERGDA